METSGNQLDFFLGGGISETQLGIVGGKSKTIGRQMGDHICETTGRRFGDHVRRPGRQVGDKLGNKVGDIKLGDKWKTSWETSLKIRWQSGRHSDRQGSKVLGG